MCFLYTYNDVAQTPCIWIRICVFCYLVIWRSKGQLVTTLFPVSNSGARVVWSAHAVDVGLILARGIGRLWFFCSNLGKTLLSHLLLRLPMNTRCLWWALCLPVANWSCLPVVNWSFYLWQTGVVYLWQTGVVYLWWTGVFTCGELELFTCGELELFTCGELELFTCGELERIPHQCHLLAPVFIFLGDHSDGCSGSLHEYC